MRILVLNPNTSESMTAGIAAAAAGGYAAGPDNPRSHWPLSASLGLHP